MRVNGSCRSISTRDFGPASLGVFGVALCVMSCAVACGEDAPRSKAPTQTKSASPKAVSSPSPLRDVSSARPSVTKPAPARVVDAEKSRPAPPQDTRAAAGKDIRKAVADGSNTRKDASVGKGQARPAAGPFVPPVKWPPKMRAQTAKWSEFRQGKAAKHLKRGRVDKAIARLKTVLAIDPTSRARYTLAKALLVKGDRATALEVLSQLKVAACYPCLYWLHQSTRDAAFASLHKDPKYQALVKGLKVEIPDLAKLSLQMVRSVHSGSTSTLGKAGMLAHVFREGRRLRIRRWYTGADDNGFTLDPTREKTRWFGDAREVRGYLGPFQQVYRARNAVCKGRCCTIEVREGEHHCRVNGLQITAVCWWIVSAKKAVPYRLRVNECDTQR